MDSEIKKNILICVFLINVLWIVSNKIDNFKNLVEKVDHFENPIQKIIAKEVFDDFYAPVYTTLISDNITDRTKFEVQDLIAKTLIKQYSNPHLLDICAGGGDHLKWLSEKNIENLKLTGIDKSEHMLNETKYRIGKTKKHVNLINRDIHDDDLFMKSTFTHITCYYFSIYYIYNIDLLKNIIYWLKPKGYFIVHMVDLEKFDPILDVAHPFSGINPQKYMKNRITDSTVIFKKFIYKSNFILNKTNAFFEESFKFKNIPKIRKQKHKLIKINMEKLINKFGELNMELKSVTNLEEIGYHHQYILYFQKV